MDAIMASSLTAYVMWVPRDCATLCIRIAEFWKQLSSEVAPGMLWSVDCTDSGDMKSLCAAAAESGLMSPNRPVIMKWDGATWAPFVPAGGLAFDGVRVEVTAAWRKQWRWRRWNPPSRVVIHASEATERAAVRAARRAPLLVLTTADSKARAWPLFHSAALHNVSVHLLLERQMSWGAKVLRPLRILRALAKDSAADPLV